MACNVHPEPAPQSEPEAEPHSEPQPELLPVTDHDSDSCMSAMDYTDVDPIDRSEGVYFSSLVYSDEAEREAFLD